MATFTIKRKGINYVSNESATNTFTFTYKNNNYIKYRPLDSTGALSETISYYADYSGTTSSGSLSPNIDYYLAKYQKNATKPYGLSLSHDPNGEIFGWISKADFDKGFNMPGAKIRFHPNGGRGNGSYSQPQYYVNEEGYSQTTMEVTVEGPMDLIPVDTLFRPDDAAYLGDNWRINHPKTGTKIGSTSINIHQNYATTYPETTITLYAQWKWDPDEIIHISYFKDASGTILHQTQCKNGFDAKYVLNDYTPPTQSGKKFIGWGEGHWTAYPKYYIGSDFYFSDTDYVELYNIYQDIDTDNKIITFDPGGGFYGPRVVQCSGWTTYSIPGGSIGETFNDSDYPTRPGYKFTGWYSTGNGGDTKQPGASGVFWSNHTYWTAQWSSNLTTISAPNSNIQFKNTNYSGYKESYKIEPTSYDRKLTLSFNPSDKRTERKVMLRIIDHRGAVVQDSFLFHKLKSGSTSPSVNPILLANKTYYLEFASEQVVSGSAGQTYSFSVTWEPVEYGVTIDPNGGSYYIAGGSTQTSTITSKFDASDDYVRISSNSTNSNSVGGSTGNQISLPWKTGYQFKEWNCRYEPTLIKPRTISGYEAQTTSYTPANDFTTKTLWSPNIFYIRYNSNNTHDGSGYMSDTEHYYNISSNLWDNQYKKFARITFNGRGGSFSTWTNDTNLKDVVIDNLTQSATLEHTFTGWKTGSTTYSNQQSITLTPSSYGTQIDLQAQWQIESFSLPHIIRAGFRFMGWYTDPDEGELVGLAGAQYSPEDAITLYAHWEPIGLVWIYVDNEWKWAIPYVYNGTSWKRAMSYTHNGTTWKQGAGSGQNMTNEQLENL